MDTKRSYYYLQIEMVITRMVIAIPIITLFYYRIGMNQFLVGLSQAVFSLALLLTDLPTGWIADRFSRKWANVIGDGLVATGFVAYAFAPSFYWVVGCEVIIGVGMAFSNGCDLPLLAMYCQQLDKSLGKTVAKVSLLAPFAEAAAVLLGGLIGAWHLRWAMMATPLPFIAATWLSWQLVDGGVRRQSNGKHPLRDMYDIAKRTLHGHKELAWASMAAATMREITHAVIWALTPLLILAGVPAWLVGLAWAINCAAVALGAWLAGKFAGRLTDHSSYQMIMGLALISCFTLGLGAYLVTVWLYFGLGLVRGWGSVTSGLLVQHRAPEDVQTTVHSVASTLGRLIYIPLVAGVNGLAGHHPSRAFLANAMVFAPLVWLTYRGLKRKLE